MKVIKNINNNVAICIDDDGFELIVFAKGVGFKKPPYKIDLQSITKTYYGIDESYVNMITSIPEIIIEASEKIIEYAETKLDEIFNQNVIFTLADHINFAIERYDEKLVISLPIKYDIKHLYEEEYKIGVKALSILKSEFDIILPNEESIYIALHIINSKAKDGHKLSKKKLNDELVSELTDIIEKKFNISVDKESFNYSRFVSHMYYLFKRVEKNETIESDNAEVYNLLKKDYPRISNCADEVSEYLFDKLNWSLSSEEKIYLILHINRLCVREDCYQ